LKFLIRTIYSQSTAYIQDMANQLIVHRNQKKIIDILDENGRVMDCEHEMILRKKKDLLIISLLQYICDVETNPDNHKMFVRLMEKIVLGGFIDIESAHPRYDSYKTQLIDAVRQLIREKIDSPYDQPTNLITYPVEKKGMIYRDHRIIRMINRGAYGILFETESSIDMKHYAIKQTPYMLREGWNDEILILSELTHPNVIRYYGSGIDRNTTFQNADDSLYLYIQMELMDIDLEKLISIYPAEERKKFVHNIFDQVTEGIQYIHKKNVIHRDLKPSNIMIRFDENDDPTIAITDFGCAKMIKLLDCTTNITDELLPSTEAIGTLVYVAPEIQSFEPYEFSSDIYSLGIILLRLLSDNLLDGTDNFNHNISDLKNQVLEQFIRNMICHNPSERPDIAQINRMWNEPAIIDIFEIDELERS